MATSTTEAKIIIAATEATKDIIWLKRLYCKLIGFNEIPVLRVDNNAALKLAQNPEYHKTTKHIPLKQFFVREKVSEKKIEVERISKQNQVADIMINPLQPQRLQFVIKQLGISDMKQIPK